MRLCRQCAVPPFDRAARLRSSGSNGLSSGHSAGSSVGSARGWWPWGCCEHGVVQRDGHLPKEPFRVRGVDLLNRRLHRHGLSVRRKSSTSGRASIHAGLRRFFLVFTPPSAPWCAKHGLHIRKQPSARHGPILDRPGLHLGSGVEPGPFCQCLVDGRGVVSWATGKSTVAAGSMPAGRALAACHAKNAATTQRDSTPAMSFTSF